MGLEVSFRSIPQEDHKSLTHVVQRLEEGLRQKTIPHSPLGFSNLVTLTSGDFLLVAEQSDRLLGMARCTPVTFEDHYDFSEKFPRLFSYPPLNGDGTPIKRIRKNDVVGLRGAPVGEAYLFIPQINSFYNGTGPRMVQHLQQQDEFAGILVEAWGKGLDLFCKSGFHDTGLRVDEIDLRPIMVWRRDRKYSTPPRNYALPPLACSSERYLRQNTF